MPNTSQNTFLSKDVPLSDLAAARHDFFIPRGGTMPFRLCRRRSHEAADDMGNSYLTHVRRTMNRQTAVAKKLMTKDFFACCGPKGIHVVTTVTLARTSRILSRKACVHGTRARYFRLWKAEVSGRYWRKTGLKQKFLRKNF